MKYIITLTFILFYIYSFGQKVRKEPKPVPISIQWVDSLPGDFSFTKDWNYPLGVEVKKDGNPGCADGGFCPERCYAMMDSNGMVLNDSARIFYQLLDTTHRLHSIECEAWCYEWAGTDFIEVLRKNTDTVLCSTETGIATHCSLILNIIKNTCYATIDLRSIVHGGDATFYCISGSISIDKKLWANEIMKASFSFNFAHPENPKEPMYWKGIVYAKIKKYTPEQQTIK